MLTFTVRELAGYEPAFHGMRNPMNSWKRSDSVIVDDNYILGPVDHELALRLRAGGPVHAKYARMIEVWMDITAPLYWWKEYDTYKVGTVANSCSTMHRLMDKRFELDDFSHDHLAPYAEKSLLRTIDDLNWYRDIYLKFDTLTPDQRKGLGDPHDKKEVWYWIIQILPTSYNQTRTVMLSYETLHNIYHYRKEHKLDEWRTLCKGIEKLPYSDLITYEGDFPASNG